MSAGLKKLGLSFVPTQTNFLLVDIGPKAEEIHSVLMKEGIIVRSMSSFGLSSHVRVTIGLPDENKKFLEVLDKVMG